MRERCVHLLLVGSERIPLDGGAVWYNTGFDYSEKDGGGLDDNVGSERIPLDGGAVWYNTGFDYSEKDGGGLDDKWHHLGGGLRAGGRRRRPGQHAAVRSRYTTSRPPAVGEERAGDAATLAASAAAGE
eukprot:gene20362-27633_t